MPCSILPTVPSSRIAPLTFRIPAAASRVFLRSRQTPAVVDVHGRVDQFSTYSVTGKLDPMPDKLLVDVAVAFTNTGLTAFSPYTEVYVGRPLEKGKLSLALHYQIDHKNPRRPKRHFHRPTHARCEKQQHQRHQIAGQARHRPFQGSFWPHHAGCSRAWAVGRSQIRGLAPDRADYRQPDRQGRHFAIFPFGRDVRRRRSTQLCRLRSRPRGHSRRRNQQVEHPG